MLGILCATDAASGSNAIGGVGIAPRAEGYLSSWFMGYTDEWEEISNIPGAILAAALKLFDLRLATAGPPSGEVILIETTVDADVDLGGGVTALLQVPVEANYGNWDQIRRATLAGITVVEAGGNGDQAGTGAPLDMVLAANPDSEAIIVSAAQPLGGWFERTAWAPRGNRVDCFGWARLSPPAARPPCLAIPTATTTAAPPPPRRWSPARRSRSRASPA